MALPIKDQARYWGITTACFVLVLWILGDVILPFVLGGAIAYCLDPIADWLESLGLSRALSVTVIMVAGILAFLLILLPGISLIFEQANGLVSAWPDLVDRLQSWLQSTFPAIMDESSELRRQIANFMQRLGDSAGSLITNVLSSAAGIVNILVLLIIVPVVAFYLLLDWDRMIAQIDELLPRDHAPIIRKLAAEMDQTLASFIRGQGLVCLILGMFYALALMLAGLNFGLVVGAIAGLLTFIPYIGALFGGLLAIGLAIFQSWNENAADLAAGVEGATGGVGWLYVLIIYAIFQIGQFVEGNILTPKLVGSSVGLHPVWLLFALSVFGALFGFVGLLVAVPVAALIGVVARFAISQYRDSKLYYGHVGPDPIDDTPEDEG